MVKEDTAQPQKDLALGKIIPINDVSLIPELIKQHTGRIPKRLGLEMDILPTAYYLNYQKLFPDSKLVDISPLILSVRMIKSDYEISCIAKAAKMADNLFEKIPSFLKESETEVDLALRAESYYRSKGHPGLNPTRGFNRESIYGHIMSGESAALPSCSSGPTGGKGLGPFFSQGASMECIGHHEPIVVDYAANIDCYISDQTRIFSLGRLKEKLIRAHDVMLKVQDSLSIKGLPGVRAEDLYNLAHEIVEKAGLAHGFMGYPDPVPFVGHGVGLELDEWPIIGRGSNAILSEGMVIALEPKFIFPGEGVVGIENTFVVTKSEMKKLNQFPDAIMIC
jgi:Xaa-Pro aminopeptidase